jgi:glutamine amidotransferase
VVNVQRPSKLIDADAAFYHVHSLVARPADRDVIVGTATHGEEFVTIVERDNVFGAQFHPEKSSRDGLALLRNFIRA